MKKFRIGDKVYAGYDDKCDIYGKIVEIKNGIYYVELFDRGISGGRFAYRKEGCVMPPTPKGIGSFTQLL